MKLAQSRRQVCSMLLGALTLLVACVAAGAGLPVRTLVVGSEQQFPPFAIGMTDATADGFTVELWREVANEQALPYAIRVRPFDELLHEFKAGNVDVLLNLAQSDERRKFADFSVTHADVGGAIFVRTGDPRIRAEDDLTGKSIVVLRGDLAHDYAIGKGWKMQLVLVDNVEQGFRLLASGRQDAMLISKLAGLQTIRTQGIAGVSALGAKVGFSQRFAFAVRKGDAELLARINEGLALAKTNGIYDRLYEKWFGLYEDRMVGWRTIAPTAAAVALVALAAWLIWFRGRLRRDRDAAATLRDSEERWKFALEGAGDGVWDANLVDGTSAYSKRWKEILGFSESEIGTSSDEWSKRVHPDDLDRALRDNQACVDGRADTVFSEFRMRAKDGHWVWILDRGKVVHRSASGKATRMIGTHADISRRKASEAREAARASVMTQIATGGVLSSILDSVVRDVESRCGWACSIMLVDSSGEFLVTGAAPSLPDFFNRAVAGIGMAPDQGSCGAAAYSKTRVVCEDIRTDPRWTGFREVAETAGLRSCWSEPILGQGGKVLGTFSAYHRQPSVPSAENGDDIGMAAQFAAIAIEHERVGQALRSSEALLLAKSRTLEATLERMEQGLMMVNPGGVVEVCNRRAIELLDLPARLMASRPTFAQVLEYQWSTDEFAHTPEDVRAFVRAGGILDQPQLYERMRPNGRTIEIQSVPIFGGGVLRTYTDISERKRGERALRESEERLQRALDASRLALWDFDLNSGDIYLSEAWSEMLGGERAVTRTTFDALTAMVPDEDQGRIAAAMQDALRGVTPSYALEHQVRRPDGQMLWVLSQGRVVERDADGRGRRAVGTNRDVTERKRAEATQRVLESQLREAQKLEAIGTLAGGIAHDFNNIMAAILGNVAFARQDVGEGHPVQAYLEQINKAGLRARSLVQQILAFSRRQPSEFVSVRLRPIVEETIAMLQSTVGARVTLRAVLPELELAVTANPTQLQQVLLNLGTNAWHALPDGAGRIEIGLQERVFSASASAAQRAGLAPGHYAHLWVRDNGHGMDDETRQRIFEPFFTTKPVGQGTGLGLAVAHGIIEAHGGAIEVTSGVGEGSTFDLYLPLNDYKTAPAPLESGESDAWHGRGQHVLYVDDDEVMALMVKALLQRLGYRATITLDAKEAVAIVAHDPAAVDLVVTDFNMPTWSGLDVVRALARIRPGLPVAISSGFVSDELRSNAHALGVVAVMQKEHTLEALGPLVHAALSPARGR
ncbi:MAG: transporter substrate-binding domain-containing protein [Burkholderiales bacterium]